MDVPLGRLRNDLQTTLLTLALIITFTTLTYYLLGVGGLVWLMILGIGFSIFSPRISTKWIMRFQGARPLNYFEDPEIHQITQQLAQKAGLDHTPKLYYIPTTKLNAFATGTDGDTAIALTEGLLNNLNSEELAGVLAHEISHISHRDLQLKKWVMLFSRTTRTLSSIGKLMLFLSLPLLLIGQVLFSWQTILLLIFAPTLSNFLELAISRTREFEADRAAAYLTGKPEALASALHKLEQINRREQWGQMLRVQVPDVLLSHPNTKERINRLLSIHKQLFEVSF